MSERAVLSGRAEAYERFCEQLRDARMRPGQFVSQRELMVMLRMPLGAVRELIPVSKPPGCCAPCPSAGCRSPPWTSG